MSLNIPMISAECNKCGEISDEMEMLPMSTFFTRIKRELENQSWTVNGDETICGDCFLIDQAS